MIARLRLAVVAVMPLCASCLGDQPSDILAWDDKCAGTKEEHACLTLVVNATGSVQRRAKGDMRGTLYWALYKAGDVKWYGPGDSDEMFEGSVDNVDLSAKEASAAISLPDIPGRDYQGLAYLDDDVNGEPDDGDPVTMPKGAFDVPRGEHVRVTLTLDAFR